VIYAHERKHRSSFTRKYPHRIIFGFMKRLPLHLM